MGRAKWSKKQKDMGPKMSCLTRASMTKERGSFSTYIYIYETKNIKI